MKTSTKPSPKQATHERIVETAARAIRRSGYDGTSVADLMNQAGLTHGGFYAHFASREAMLAEAADQAGADAVAIFTRIVAAVPPTQARQALLRAYLSKQHQCHPEQGCPAAALGSETARQSPAIRQAFTRRFKEMLDVVAKHAEPAQTPAQTLATAATMIGALVLARAVDDEALSASILSAALEQLEAAP